MRNHFLTYFEDIITISIRGKSVDRFLSYVYKSKITVIDVKVIDRHEINIKIYYKDFKELESIKTSNEISIIEYLGMLKIKKVLKQNKYIIFSLILGYLLLIFLSNVIFDIQVIHNDKKIRELIINELKNYKIEKLHFKKSYTELERIEDKILNDYKDRIEWIEIEEIGTKYIVKIEERRLPKKEEEYIYQDIVAKKNAIIMKIEADNGIIIRQKNEYVKKGDIIISGRIMNGEKLTDIVKASGKVYGEVWYNIRVEFPMVHTGNKRTGREKLVYNIKFLNRKISLNDFNPFKKKDIDEQIITYNPLLPFKIIKEKQYEVKITDQIYNEGDAIKKAEQMAEEKMEEKLFDNEYVISKRTLKYYQENQKIYLDVFFKVCEQISQPQLINMTDIE